jgi:molecular chaperone GrpE
MTRKTKEKAHQEEEAKNTEGLQEEPEQVLNTGETKTEGAETTDTTAAEKASDEINYEEKYKETYDKYLRLSAEFDNYRKRNIKERADLIKTAGAEVIGGFLTVLDDFDRAMAALETSQDLEALRDGVKLIHQKTRDYLAQKGVKEIESMGQAFDTDLHDAITTIPAPNPEMAGKVIDVVQKGYFLHDKVIRHSKVVIGQ